MDWYKKYRIRTFNEGEGWNKDFKLFGRRLDDPEFKIECNITEEEFFKTGIFKLYYGQSFWYIGKATIVLDIVRIRKDKLDGLV
jgi:hypothetical protein